MDGQGTDTMSDTMTEPEPAEQHTSHGAHGDPGGHDAPGAQAGHGGHGDHAAQFRDRFWVSLALAVPVVVFSPMFADLLGYSPPDFPAPAGSRRCSARSSSSTAGHRS